jgi:hypothetical protein
LTDSGSGSGSGGGGGVGLVGLRRGSWRRVDAGDYSGQPVQIQRNAQIPRIAASNTKKFDDSVIRAVKGVRNSDSKNLF